MEKHNYSQGKIDKLPEDIKGKVNEDIVKGKTLMEIEDYLKGRGYDISYGSVHRYREKYLEKFDRLRIARDYAKILAEDNIDRPPTELNEANNALVSHIIMEAMIDDTMTIEDKIKAAQSIATLQRAQVHNEKLKIDARKAAGVIHTAMNMLKAKVFETIGKDYPDVAEAIMRIADEIQASNEIIV